MIERRSRTFALPVLVLLVGLVAHGDAYAQGRGRAGGPPPTARAAAPKDLTGTWVSVVTEHWHLRMLVPAKGDFAMLPLNPEARKIAGAWDPKASAAGGAECAAYGAPSIMRVPGRVNIRWADDNTLQLDSDAGGQTRMFRFGAGAPADQAPSWQGSSVAVWDTGARGRGAPAPGAGQLRVNTTNLRAGLLRRNGVPYSERTTLVEYFDMFTEPNGDVWLLVTSIVTDPTYLTGPYVTTSQFRKVPEKQGWDPTPCRPDQAR
jgi:hypothetical protein